MSGGRKKLRVGISMGDPAGIGPEIILKIFRDKTCTELFTPIIFGSAKVFSFQKNHFKYQVNFNIIDAPAQAQDGRLSLINLDEKNTDIRIEFGKSSPEGANLAYNSLKAAVLALKNQEIDVLVTAPIHKESMMDAGMEFAGHTEYLEQELGGKSLMMLTEDNLRVALLTHHIPLKDVPQKISVDKIKKTVSVLAESLKTDFQLSKPKIAILSLNPHAGDGGKIGSEELDIINPAIKSLREEGVLAFGSFAADSFFQPTNMQQYDAVLAMYHDQGLVAFKTLYYSSGVNYTAGLPYVRTSPDHGVGYDIAGKGIAKKESFLQAIYLAIDVYNSRKEYYELTENKLASYDHK